jgi:hypothetical protein
VATETLRSSLGEVPEQAIVNGEGDAHPALVEPVSITGVHSRVVHQAA